VILTAPGEEAQVDYGTGPMVRDPKTGKYRRTRLFVLTLGCSRKAVRLLSFRSSSRIWAELHEKAFRRLGGSTRIVVVSFVVHRAMLYISLRGFFVPPSHFRLRRPSPRMKLIKMPSLTGGYLRTVFVRRQVFRNSLGSPPSVSAHWGERHGLLTN